MCDTKVGEKQSEKTVAKCPLSKSEPRFLDRLSSNDMLSDSVSVRRQQQNRQATSDIGFG